MLKRIWNLFLTPNNSDTSVIFLFESLPKAYKYKYTKNKKRQKAQYILLWLIDVHFHDRYLEISHG